MSFKFLGFRANICYLGRTVGSLVVTARIFKLVLACVEDAGGACRPDRVQCKEYTKKYCVTGKGRADLECKWKDHAYERTISAVKTV